jgi:hypothetical protein
MLHAQRVIPYDSPYVWNNVSQAFVKQPYLFTSSNASRTSSHILHGADDIADGHEELCLTLRAARAGELAEGDLDAQCDSARSALLSTCCPSWALLGYTFPACNPTKRIDFLFVRDTITEPAQNVTIRKHWVVGTEPHGVAAQALSAGYVEKFRTAALGMLDEGSPLWASDHFGVVVELNL